MSDVKATSTYESETTMPSTYTTSYARLGGENATDTPPNAAAIVTGVVAGVFVLFAYLTWMAFFLRQRQRRALYGSLRMHYRGNGVMGLPEPDHLPGGLHMHTLSKPLVTDA